MKLKPCICSHRYGQHQHYRDGLDCAVAGCPCLDYRAATWWRRWLAKRWEMWS
jgi:hypothetical protein